MFPICKAPGPHSSISEEFLHSSILWPKKPLGSWNLVNPLLSMNEVWMDECAARLQPLVDQYKTHTTPKFRDLIEKPDHVLGTKKSLFKFDLILRYSSRFSVKMRSKPGYNIYHLDQ